MTNEELNQINVERNPPVGGAFHWRDGWFFQRLNDGCVLMTVPSCGQQVIPPNEWASIVAHVSTWGETGESWKAASDFHNGTGIQRPEADASPANDPIAAAVDAQLDPLKDEFKAIGHKLAADASPKEPR